jgi:hypothetical protein
VTPLSGLTLALRRGAALKCPTAERDGDVVIVALSAGLDDVKLERGGSELVVAMLDDDDDRRLDWGATS